MRRHSARARARSWRLLDAVAQRDEPEHQGERREREHDQSSGQHDATYETNHATTAIRTVASAIRHPARDQGHTGESMYGLSYSMSRAYGASP